ncbi:MAG: ribbon-helix-helix domain-containing protein [Candidatus Thermoplasmatota archaeon]|jgi:Arc/MetJ-type ribon-helix-helix transcriptional regulator|uniref:ribbon-helix-helix domain-containing protein n=1 Tax=Ferroplasma sp. TaxID=2591003 RepID=UPI00263566C9|nr:ribbon-helix-helix domain-containing protein [Ferroplasma sp.]MCL4311319.1 ribbon-helix-helix domain-containing protein [Candidatus Thermoplasmatota archaeon]
MTEKNEKLTIRISNEELEEIDSFLSYNSNYASRSEFIRMAVLEYISIKRVGIITKNNSIHPDPVIEKAVSRMVAAGFYKSIDSAYEEIIKEAWRHNLISEMLKNTDDEYSKIEKILEGEKKYDKQ